MKTVSQMLTWLNTPGHVKCILADITEVGNSTVSNFFLSNMAYYGNSQAYESCITGGLSFSESLSIDGTPSISNGTLEIVNTGGVYDSFLQKVWKKRPIKIYMGSPDWAKSDFVLIFDGLIDDLVSPNENSLSFSLFDKTQRLNDPITEKTLTETQYSENTLETILPLLFGECFNISPLLVDNGSTANSGAVYMINDGAIQGIVEVRDNGVPIDVTHNLTNGTFTLLTSPFGAITCSAQGQTPDTNPVPRNTTKRLTSYGTASNRFLTSEISFEDFTNTSAVGIYTSDRTNILEACNQLAKSVNANLICPSIVVNSDNVYPSKLRLVEIKEPAGSPKYYLNDDNMVINTLSISEMFPVKPSIKLAYCKNYTVQQTVADGVNPVSKFNTEYIYSTNIDTDKQTLYRDSGTVAEEQTLLISTADADAEATKRLNFWKQQRYIVSATYLPQLLFVQLGDVVQVKSARFGLASGKLGLVYSINRDWVTGLVDIGVLV